MAKTGENTQQITAEELETVLANAEAEKKAAVEAALKQAEEEKEAALKQAEEEKEAAVKAALAEYKAKTNTPSNKNISKKEVRMIPIKIEKNKNERDDVFVSVNGKNFQIKRGEKVEVPEYVVEVLENMKRMDELAIERTEEAIKNFA